MSDKPDFRTVAATSEAVRTSLSDFISKSSGDVDPPDADSTDSTEETTDDDTVEDTESGIQVPTEDGEEVQEEEATEEDTTEFEVKGQKVPLKDLLNSYETRQEISRRFDEVGKKEKRLQTLEERNRKERAELDFINEKFEEMREQVLAGNPLAAMQIAMALGMQEGDADNEQTLEKLVKQAINVADNFHAMTEEEQKIFLKNEELAHKQRKLDRAEKRQKALSEEAKLKQYYDSVLEVNKLTDTELDGAYEDIQQHEDLRTKLEKLDRKGRIDYCASWVLGKRLNTTIVEGISKVDKKLASDDKFRLALLDVIDPRCTVDDVAAIVKQYLGTSNGSAKVESEASTQGVVPKKPTTPNRAPTEKPKAEKDKVPVRSWADIIAKHGN